MIKRYSSTPSTRGGLALGLNSISEVAHQPENGDGDAVAERLTSIMTLNDVKRIELLDSGALEITFMSTQSLVIDGEHLQKLHAKISLSGIQESLDPPCVNSCQHRPEKKTNSQRSTVCGGLDLDLTQKICRWKGRPVPLTKTEFSIVKALAAFPGHVKTRNQLMDATWGREVAVFDRNIDSHLKRIRRKFRAIDAEFRCIQTLYGIGYKFEPDVG